MTDRRFFTPAGPFAASDLAQRFGATLHGASEPDRQVTDLAALQDAGPEHLGFFDNPKYADALRCSRAGVIVLSPEAVTAAPPAAVLIVHAKPYKLYARIAQLFYPLRVEQPGSLSPAATVDPTVIIGDGCVIEAGAVIGANVELGSRVTIRANAVIGQGVVVGEETEIGASATLTHCLIGKRVRILPGARIGQEGFGFAMDAEGHLRIPQLGRVVVEDDVEIGANTAIDRGAGPDTIIGRGTMIDNLVQIGHNVVVGPGCVIVAQVGISGSTRLEAGVVLAGQAGVAGHLTIGRGAQVAAHSGIMRDVEPGARMMGYPAMRSRQFFRQVAWLDRATGTKRSEDKG